MLFNLCFTWVYIICSRHFMNRDVCILIAEAYDIIFVFLARRIWNATWQYCLIIIIIVFTIHDIYNMYIDWVLVFLSFTEYKPHVLRNMSRNRGLYCYCTRFVYWLISTTITMESFICTFDWSGWEHCFRY